MDDLNTKDLNVLAWNEQGLGDQIMYGSMFNELSKKVNKLIIRIDKRLINLFILKFKSFFCPLWLKVLSIITKWSTNLLR